MFGATTSFINNFFVFAVGRFFYGYSAGMFSFLTPKYISEVSPVEKSGMLGGVSDLAVTFGILTCLGLSPFYNQNGDNDFFMNIVFFIPIALATVQWALLYTCFKYDTPPQLKKHNDYYTLKKLFSKIYISEAVESRME